VEADIFNVEPPAVDEAARRAADDLAARQFLIEDASCVNRRHDPRDAYQSRVCVDADFRKPRGERAAGRVRILTCSTTAGPTRDEPRIEYGLGRPF
jgi:hypothetical protein